MMKRFWAILLSTAMLLMLTACATGNNGAAQSGGQEQSNSNAGQQQIGNTDPTPDVPANPDGESDAEQEPDPEIEPDPVPMVQEYTILDPTVEPEGGVRDGVTYVPYNGIVEHLFFHPVIAYPELAFDGDYQSDGLDDWMLTVGEFVKILNSLYENNYILVDIADVWSETTDENGKTVMVKNTLYIPEGKKPLVFSYDDVNYYEYMLENGFAYK